MSVTAKAAAPESEASRCSLKSMYLSESISQLCILQPAVLAVHRVFRLPGQIARPAQNSQKQWMACT